MTHEEIFALDEQQYRVAERLRRLNELGFDVGEVELSPPPRAPDSAWRPASPSRVRTAGSCSGSPAWRCRSGRPAGCSTTSGPSAPTRSRRPGAGARVLRGAPLAGRGLPARLDAIPPELAGRLAPAEVFHEVLEHRWFLSEQAQRDVGTAEAAQSYFPTVLPQTPREVTTPSVIAGLARES